MKSLHEKKSLLPENRTAAIPACSPVTGNIAKTFDYPLHNRFLKYMPDLPAPAGRLLMYAAGSLTREKAVLNPEVS